MKAKVTKAFPGVIDGTTQTRTIHVGEVIEGDLAKVALRNKWAEEEGAAAPKKDPPQQPEKKDADKQPPKQPETPAKADVEIPADWKALKAPDLKKLAETIVDKQVDPAAASKVIEEEVARRAAAQPKA